WQALHGRPERDRPGRPARDRDRHRHPAVADPTVLPAAGVAQPIAPLRCRAAPGRILRIVPADCMISSMSSPDVQAYAVWAKLMWAQRRVQGDASLALVDDVVGEGHVVVDA